MNFKEGQEVVCVDDSGRSTFITPPVKKGKHYFISSVRTLKCGCIQVDVGVSSDGTDSYCSHGMWGVSSGVWWIRASRFAPIEEIPASHEEAVKELLTQELILS